jgi:hypothetical protein
MFKPGQSGNPKGRPKGSRNRLSKAVIDAWCADVEKYGAEVIERLRVEDPATYARVSASLVPKELDVEVDGEVNSSIEVVFPQWEGPDEC